MPDTDGVVETHGFPHVFSLAVIPKDSLGNILLTSAILFSAKFGGYSS